MEERKKNLTVKIKKLCVIFLTVLSVSVANGQIEQDKKLHFLAGGLASGFGYSYVYGKTQDKTKATIAGIGFAILAGTLKETIDSRQPGNRFDKNDLFATTLGGITVSFSINLFNRKKNAKKRKRYNASKK